MKFVADTAPPSRAAADPAPARARRLGEWCLAAALLAGALLWSHWPILTELWKNWNNDPNYSVGRLVPLVALYLLWTERENLRRLAPRASAWGLALIAGGQALRWYGFAHLHESLERYAFIITFAGVVWLMLGTRILWRLRWLLAFLFLMVPLPGRVHNAIAGPLQEAASASTAWVLELTGLRILREGNILLLNGETPVGVAEACSGLRMLMAFLVISAAFAYLVRRPRWQKITLLLSGVPIAVVCNLVRLSLTAYLHLWADETFINFFHDFAGLLMMPLAILLLLLEVRLLDLLVLPAPETGNAPAAVR